MTLKFNKKSEAGIRRSQQLAGLGTPSEVVQHALALYEVALEHRVKRGKLIFRDEDGTEEELTNI